MLKLTVLGCYGPYPKAKGACAGYLLENQDTKILIDCGNGVLSRLFTYCNDLNKLDAILISHLHSDHMCDLMVLRYALGIGQMMGKVHKALPIYLPATPVEDFERIQYNNAFDRKIITENSVVTINDIKITFQKTDHPVECYAMAFEHKGKKFVYSGDTKYFDQLSDFIKGSDLFLCEGGILEKDRTENTPHLSAKQAGEIALSADVKRLVLTHFWPETKSSLLFAEAIEHYPYILELAEEGKVYCI